MNRPTIEEILSPKPEARPRIYVYAIAADSHAGLLKVGQTTRNVKQRVAEQLKTAAITNYTIELDEWAERDDGGIITDHAVREALRRKGLVVAAYPISAQDVAAKKQTAREVKLLRSIIKSAKGD